MKKYKRLGVTHATLRRWDRKGYLVPKRTFGNHRRYSCEQLADFLPELVNLPCQQAEETVKSTYIYARVSSSKQKKDGNLDRQVERLKKYYKEHFDDETPLKIIKEYGSGLNPMRLGLWRLLKQIEQRKVARVLIAYKDRHTRFGFPFLEYVCGICDVPIIEVERGLNTSLEEQLVTDLMALIASFSGKLYQLRALQAKGYDREEKERERIDAIIERYVRRDSERILSKLTRNLAAFCC
ncbi:MAG: IS607 family transposase [Candidatus Lokiarchaeota archaeon]|nr:IS607 family transposase [Candidatus Harpocratesius repetitus]